MDDSPLGLSKYDLLHLLIGRLIQAWVCLEELIESEVGRCQLAIRHRFMRSDIANQFSENWFERYRKHVRRVPRGREVEYKVRYLRRLCRFLADGDPDLIRDFDRLMARLLALKSVRDLAAHTKALAEFDGTGVQFISVQLRRKSLRRRAGPPVGGPGAIPDMDRTKQEELTLTFDDLKAASAKMLKLEHELLTKVFSRISWDGSKIAPRSPEPRVQVQRSIRTR